MYSLIILMIFGVIVFSFILCNSFFFYSFFNFYKVGEALHCDQKKKKNYKTGNPSIKQVSILFHGFMGEPLLDHEQLGLQQSCIVVIQK